MPFLTDIDSRAAVKGSRDPLGLVPVWSRFGRQVVGNLTTVSSSVRGFTTLLLGYYFAEEVQLRDGAASQPTLELFLKFEQLAGYVRWHIASDDDFRGRDRVVERLGRGTKVTLGGDSGSQILSNQKVYGLWGLFSVPARSSGLLASEEPILTPQARDFVESQYISRLTKAGFKNGRVIVDLLRRHHAELHLEGRDAGLAQSLASILSGAVTHPERTFYDHHLANGGEEDRTNGCQPLLADLLATLPGGAEFGLGELRKVTGWAAKAADSEALALHLEAIGHIEALLVPMENAFSFLLARDHQSLDYIAGEIRKAWGPALRHLRSLPTAELRPTLLAAFHGDDSAADRFTSLAMAFESGDYSQALQLLVDHNRYVMHSRNGSQPWARVEAGKVDVRYRDESGSLIPGSELPHWWRNTYFINSLHGVVSTLKVA